MTEPQMSIEMKPLVEPETSKWASVKQQFLDLLQNQADHSDNVLSEQIIRVLEANHLLGRRAIAHTCVTVNDRVVTLTGHVARSIDGKQAEAATREAPGVAAVVNLLTGDYELMIDVAQALGHNQETQVEQIQVDVQYGVVYLSGTVSSASVRTAATQIAARVPQARGIVNIIKTPGLVLDTDEERFVQPQIGKGVYATDGQVGRLHRVVISPQNRRVTMAVVYAQPAFGQEADWPLLSTKSLLQSQPKRHILIPITSIECMPSGAIRLNVKSDAAIRLNDYDQHNFVTPPADWLPPYPYALADVQFCKGS